MKWKPRQSDQRALTPRPLPRAGEGASGVAPRPGCGGFRPLLSHAAIASLLVAVFVSLAGCQRRDDRVREIEIRQQQQRVIETDHLREAFDFVSRLGELDDAAAKQRIVSLLNGWIEEVPTEGEWTQAELIATLGPPWTGYRGLGDLDALRFTASDVDYLRLNYLLKQVTTWAGQATGDDPLWSDWLAASDPRLEPKEQAQLREASRLFDWTVRNVGLEPMQSDADAPPSVALPAGLVFQNPGYRQTMLQTLTRGRGDAWQRARVFIGLCRQRQIDACMLGLQVSGVDEPVAWTVGVRIGEDLFLFEPQLGIPIPGPGQTGIATLNEARQDSSVLRRLNVPGWFDYPIDAQMIQQTVAMLDAPPESLSRRMAHLEAGLTGEARMVLRYDVEASGEAFAALPGIAGARLWPMAIKSRIYREAMDEAIRNNLPLAAWEASQWGMLGSGFPLARARWQHLTGNFDRQDDDEGARVMYMRMRHPEFKIEDLRYNVDLQKEYGIRRELGQSTAEYDMRVQQIQAVMRHAKRAATYWLSLIHYDTGQYENAQNWFEKRVLGDDAEPLWEASARYNLARSLEQQGEVERADELYRTVGDPQEHGNRIRARLLTRTAD